MGTFRLDPSPPQGASPQPSGWEGLGSAVLLQNARWFTQIRWVAVVVLTLFAAAGSGAPEAFRSLRLEPPGAWPWVLAGFLTLVNILIVATLHWLSPRATRAAVVANIWMQIVVDLLVLTVLVHLVGSTETVIAFAYLFHITLACIFLGRRESFFVMLLSAVLFLSVVAAESAGLLPPHCILAHGVPFRAPDALSSALVAGPTVFGWLVVWYLVSTISGAVRQRDRELDAANTRLLLADAEKNLQILRVTHDLKAPFSGIESNIQVLRAAHWDDIPQAVRDIICRIEARGATLRARIGDILTLGNLRSAPEFEPDAEPVDLQALLAAVIQEAQGLATQKGVSVELKSEQGEVRSSARQLRILFSNLVANAVSYSPAGSTVEVTAAFGKDVRVRVADHGIGISEKALPHIFDDYYRSKEAALFNPESTGLGLAIVRQVVQNLGLSITVESEPSKGSSFEVVIPPGSAG